jgi:hypothetical protein
MGQNVKENGTGTIVSLEKVIVPTLARDVMENDCILDGSCIVRVTKIEHTTNDSTYINDKKFRTNTDVVAVLKPMFTRTV